MPEHGLWQRLKEVRWGAMQLPGESRYRGPEVQSRVSSGNRRTQGVEQGL